MTVHDIRKELTKINKSTLLIREVSTQPTVINMLDQLISQVCALGDKLGNNEGAV